MLYYRTTYYACVYTCSQHRNSHGSTTIHHGLTQHARISCSAQARQPIIATWYDSLHDSIYQSLPSTCSVLRYNTHGSRFASRPLAWRLIKASCNKSLYAAATRNLYGTAGRAIPAANLQPATCNLQTDASWLAPNKRKKRKKKEKEEGKETFEMAGQHRKLVPDSLPSQHICLALLAGPPAF